MRVPFVDLGRQYAGLRSEIDAAIRRVLDSAQFILGNEVEAFEREIGRYLGVKRAVAVASGTDALEIALEASGVARGDKVVTSPLTFFATAAAILHRAATPVLADIDPANYNIDPGKVHMVLARRENHGKVRAIIPVHLYGRAVAMEPVLEAAEPHGAVVIEDAAQAIGAEDRGKKVGAIGTVGCFSFYPTKNLGAYGDGGLITTNDDELADKFLLLRNHGALSRHYHKTIGYNSRLDALQAAVLRAKLRRLDAWADARRANARYYDQEFSGLRGLETPQVLDRRSHVYHLYTLRVRRGRRDDLQSFLRARGIETAVYYPRPIHRQPGLSRLGYPVGSLHASEAASREVLSLPIFPELTDPEKRYVVDQIGAYFRQGKGTS